MSDIQEKMSYITLLSTLNYLPGVIALHDSVKRTGTRYPFLVGVSSSIPANIDNELRLRGMHVVRLPKSIEISSDLKDVSGHWGNTFDKILLFGLSEFSKLVYLDSDMMVLKNLDELFKKPHLSAVAAGYLENSDWTRLNSGLMVIQPEDHLSEKIMGSFDQAMEEVNVLGNSKIGDQDVINAYYSEWPLQKNLHLDESYNLFFSDIDAYIKKHGYQMPVIGDNNSKDIRVVHFIGNRKPWMKWSNIRHFLKYLRNKNSCKWERKVFLIYISNLKKLKLH